MLEIFPKPLPATYAWNYDGSNWATIESEMESLGIPVDGVESGGSVTITLNVLVGGAVEPVQLVASTGDWFVSMGDSTSVSVMSDSQIRAMYLPVTVFGAPRWEES